MLPNDRACRLSEGRGRCEAGVAFSCSDAIVFSSTAVWLLAGYPKGITGYHMRTILNNSEAVVNKMRTILIYPKSIINPGA
jgi:hypothetical protein